MTDTTALLVTASTNSDDYVEIAGKRYLTNTGLARQLRRHTRTIERWTAQRIGPPKIKIGNLELYDPDSIAKWLASREQMPLRRQRRATG